MKTMRYLLSIAGAAIILVSGCKKDTTETMQRADASDASDATQGKTVTFLYNGDSVTYGIITSKTTGRKWLDRNLGAARKATAFNDYQAYGDLIQWGRPADGHQLVNWTSSIAGTFVNGTTTKLAQSDHPKTSLFILGSLPYNDWRSDNNMNRWFAKPQGPCPKGWHVPTLDEWEAEISTTQGGTATSGGIIDYNTAYTLLKLTTAGFRRGTSSSGSGTLMHPGESGYYHSSTLTNFGTKSEANIVQFASTFAQSSYANCDYGNSIRCIKN
jgi:uncharacterized protein (TIGR02145 family)